MSLDSNLHSVSIVEQTLAPSPGTFANIGLNTLHSLDPGPGPWRGIDDNGTIFKLWTGGAFCKEYSAYGGLAAWAGGHGAYFGNEAYVFDISTRLWVRVGFPSPYPESQGEGNPNGEFPDGQPWPPHTYDGVQYLSPANGGGAKGSFLNLAKAGASGITTQYIHRIPLDTPSNQTGAWSRWANITAAGGTTGYCQSEYDPSRNCYWLNSNSNTGNSFMKIDAATAVITVYPGQQYVTGSYVGHLAYHPGFDMLLNVVEDGASGQAKIVGKMLPPSSSWTQLNIANPVDGPISASNREVSAWGLQWSIYGGYFVAYRARGSYVVNKLVPPSSSPLTNPWTWVPVTLTGAGGAVPSGATDNTGNGAYSRFQEVPALSTNGNPCFVWPGSSTDPVQLWRL